MKKYDFGFYLTRFLTTYLPSQRGIKANTQLSYRDTFSLLLIYLYPRSAWTFGCINHGSLRQSRRKNET